MKSYSSVSRTRSNERIESPYGSLVFGTFLSRVLVEELEEVFNVFRFGIFLRHSLVLLPCGPTSEEYTLSASSLGEIGREMERERGAPLVLSSEIHHSRFRSSVVSDVGLLEETVELIRKMIMEIVSYPFRVL